MLNIVKSIFIFISVLTLTVGCNTETDPIGNINSSPIGSSPIPDSDSNALNSPLPTPGLEAIPFAIDKPLTAGQTTITGTGYPNVGIRLDDVTFAGSFVAATRIKSDGTFEIELPQPLEARHRLGLAIDVSGTEWSIEDFRSSEFYGDESRTVPQIGFYYDTALVEES